METEVAPKRSALKVSRRVLCVVVGFIVIVILSIGTDAALHMTGVMPSGPLYDAPLLLLATTYRGIYNIVGSYVTARLAPDHPLRFAIILGAIGVCAGTVGAIVGHDLGPSWYPISIVVLALPTTWLGGRLFEYQSRKMILVSSLRGIVARLDATDD